MLLRRISEHVRTQNWTAIGIDFLIVVVGVFVGLQVSNWNDARAEQERLSRYIDELQLDLAAEMEEMRGIQEVALARHAATSYLLEQAIGWQRPEVIARFGDDFVLPPIPEVEIEAGQAILTETLRMETFDGQRHTFDALTNTGEFQLFNQHPVARDLREYYADVVAFQDFEQNYLLPRYLDLTNTLHGNGIARFGGVDLPALILVVQGDAELASRLSEFTLLAEVQYVRLSRLVEQAEPFESRLEEVR